jgi:hypothetical protein
MKVTVWVRDQAITIEVGPGNQRLKWLALVAIQRYESHSGHSFACVASGRESRSQTAARDD